MSIHQRIRTARARLGLTAQQFADAVGVTRGAVQQWEKEGGTAPKRAHQAAVAKLMEITVAELVDGQPSPTSATTAAPSLALTLENLSSYLVEMDATTRHRAGFLLADLADNPDHHAQIAAMLEAAAAPKVPVKATATDEDSRRLVVWSEQFRAEQQRKRDVAKRKRKEG